jgi:hypothetical protein
MWPGFCHSDSRLEEKWHLEELMRDHATLPFGRRETAAMGRLPKYEFSTSRRKINANKFSPLNLF